MPIGHIRWNVLKLMVVFLKGLKGFYLCGVEGEKNLTSMTNCRETPVWETPQWVPSDLTLHPFKISSLTLIWATHAPPPLFSFLSLCLEYLLMYKIFEFLYGYHNQSFKVMSCLERPCPFWIHKEFPLYFLLVLLWFQILHWNLWTVHSVFCHRV